MTQPFVRFIDTVHSDVAGPMAIKARPSRSRCSHGVKISIPCPQENHSDSSRPLTRARRLRIRFARVARSFGFHGVNRRLTCDDGRNMDMNRLVECVLSSRWPKVIV